MIKFNNNILQFGFGAVGKSFFEKVKEEIDFNENNYYVISRDISEFDAFINMGGIAKNFITLEINKNNFSEEFNKYLQSGDLLIDFADTVGTKDILKWSIDNEVMYINTGEADWPENWYSIFKENLNKVDMKNKYSGKVKYPIILQHGNNPGLVSHFVKEALSYIIIKQFKKNKDYKVLKKLLKENKFNEISKLLNVKMIHVNDIDLQKTNFTEKKLSNTWCVDSFFFELLSEATFNIGFNNYIPNPNKEKCNLIDLDNGFIELKNLAVDTKIKTYYPNGFFEGFLVPHEETITIAKSLEVKDQNNNLLYRPSVMFIYSPCDSAKKYLTTSKVNDYPNIDLNKPLDCENVNNRTITRGYIYPNDSEIIYREKIIEGTEYVGVLLIGDNFKPVWVGNRIETNYLYKKNKNSYWQTPTITPVAMSALAAICWMITNKNNPNASKIHFPDEIPDYKYILKIAEKYISKTVYKTFDLNLIENDLDINIQNFDISDFLFK